jgi:hypothetical protein
MLGKKVLAGSTLGENYLNFWNPMILEYAESLVLSVCIFLKVSLPSYRMKFVRFLLGREYSKVFGQQEVFSFKT